MSKFKTEFETDRANDQLRNIEVEFDFTPNALASVLYRQGETLILCCITKERALPRWFPRDATKGWIHAEYALLPGSTDSRFRRERNGAKGRTAEIERLIAIASCQAVDLEALGPLSLVVDCDVLNADGGTRCASITAAGLAVRLAIRRLIEAGECLPAPLRKPHDRDAAASWTPPELDEAARRAHERAVLPNDLAAVSVGLIDGDVHLDLDYILDSNADVDMNVIMTSDDRLVEIQGTGEEATFSIEEMHALTAAVHLGLRTIFDLQDLLMRDAE